MFIVFRFRAVSFLVVSVDCNSVCNLDPSGVRTILEDSRGCALGRHIHMTDRVKTTPNVVNSIFLALHDAKHFIPCIMTICHNSLVPRPSSITAYRTVVWADDVAIEYVRWPRSTQNAFLKSEFDDVSFNSTFAKIKITVLFTVAWCGHRSLGLVCERSRSECKR